MRATNVRSERTTFLGRVRELAQLHALFEAGDALITVVGPAGTGKTRFVTRYAELHTEHWAKDDGGGVWFCDLTEAHDAFAVVGAIGRALDVPLSSAASSGASSGRADESLKRIGEALAERGRTLLVLDNCEQVVDGVVSVLASLRTLCPATYVLATSRELLRVTGERAFELPPLAEGVALFVDRARLVRAGYTLDADAEIVAEIVRALDGLPLAIELAAARMGVLDARGIRDRLGKRLDLLSAGPRDRTDRQRTLRSALDWSWQLLSPEEEAGLRQCAVFSSGFSVEAAEAVLDLGGRALALDVVHALKDKSLLRAEPSEDNELRLGMLESIRAYALEKLDASTLTGEGDATRARHARYYVDRGTAEATQAFRRGGFVEIENLLAAHQWAVSRASIDGPHDVLRAMLALAPVLSLRGPFERYLALLDSTLALTENHENALVAEVRIARAWARWPYGLVDGAREDLDRATELARRAGNDRLVARALAHRATLENHAGNPDEARALCLRALPMLRAVGDAEFEATVLGDLGVMALDRARNEEAIGHFGQALAASRAVGHRANVARYLNNVGAALYNDGRLEEARAHYEDALAILSELHDNQWSGIVLGNLAEVFQELGLADEARANFERALEAYRRTGDRAFMGSTLCDVAAFHWEQGELEAARGCLVEAIDLLRATSRGGFAAHATAMLGAIEAHRGRIEAATTALDEAERDLAKQDDPVHSLVHGAFRGHLEVARARKALDAGDRGASSAHAKQARARLAVLEKAKLKSDDLRIARRLLARAITTLDAGEVQSKDSALVVHTEGRWFRPPGARHAVDIDRRPSLRHMLVALAKHAHASPDEALSIEALMRVGWPGEKMAARSGIARVHVALHTLRKMGLRSVLRNDRRGYFLDPAVDLVFAAEMPENER